MPYKNDLSNRREVLKGRFPWFFLHWLRDEKTFKTGYEKIVTQVRCEYPKFCYSTDEFYGSRALFFIQTSRWNMKFLTGILNSKLIAYWLKNKGKVQGALLKLDKEPLLNIPLPKPEFIDKITEEKIIVLVDKILTAKRASASADTSALEREIDRLVYELYGLTEKEIRIIAGKLSS